MSFLGLSSTLRYYIANTSLAIIPIAILIAMTRFNLFDVNRVISVTLLYSIAFIVVTIGAMSGLARVSVSMAAVLDLPPWAVQGIMLSVLLAAIALCHRGLLARFEKLLFPARVRLECGLPLALEAIRGAGSLMSAITAFVDALRDGLDPVTLAAYTRTSDAWVNVYAFGAAITPMLHSNSRIVARLERAAELLDLDDSQGSDAFSIGAQTSLVLPVSIDGTQRALVFVGPKRSSDVYISSERAWLSALLSALSATLSRFEQHALLEDTRRAAEGLRRYVPAAVAQEILAGRSLEAGECSVTLMFVDMRGYSAFAEARSVTQVFSLLDGHTQRVSAIVSQHGGHIVEFNGDGMMAVFGVPNVLERKEECAAAAAREIHMHLAQHVMDAPAQVGVGIATGTAYVGSLRSIDRWIWTAVGEATNRAARLQALTRDLAAETVIDESTWRALERERSGFYPLQRQQLRGLVRRQNLFFKPLYAPLSAPATASELAVPAAQ